MSLPPSLLLQLLVLAPTGRDTLPHPSFTPRRVADGVYAVLGDTGRGSEGRSNAGFIVTREGVVVIDALASPAQGDSLLRAIRQVTPRPVRWLVLTHHHPDHHFGAIVFKRAGAQVIAHPDRRVLANEGGEDALVADWVRVVGLDAMRGFEFADVPDRPVTRSDTLHLGGKAIVIAAAGGGHSAGDLLVWLPRERVLFAGDLLVEDAVTMVVDGSAPALLRGLDQIDRLGARVVVPGHGSIPSRPRELVARTRAYISGLATDMRALVERGVPMQRALKSMPPPDENRPVSLNSRRRRNAARVYVQAERAYMGLEDSIP
ncbi:MAG TPA: MBL fold metallo-hydrolase [Gemmatimonadales bacterium]|nr:MBL fold metallo-hydrolase [Gemmatimonadales bacterium]